MVVLFTVTQDLHALDMEHYSYGGATITWAQIVNAGSVPPSSTVMNYEHYHKLYGTGPNIPKHYFTVGIHRSYRKSN